MATDRKITERYTCAPAQAIQGDGHLFTKLAITIFLEPKLRLAALARSNFFWQSYVARRYYIMHNNIEEM